MVTRQDFSDLFVSQLVVERSSVNWFTCDSQTNTTETYLRPKLSVHPQPGLVGSIK
jgi:hypothetical protein